MPIRLESPAALTCFSLFHYNFATESVAYSAYMLLSRCRLIGSGSISMQAATTSADQDAELAVQSSLRADPLRRRHLAVPQPSIPVAFTMV
jgi:hypothetical protein